LVEGFIHTSNRQDYMKRLFSWGFIMFGGSWLLELILPYGNGIPNNIFFSLATCFTLLYMIDLIRNSEDSKVRNKLTVYAIVIGFLALFTEASFLGIGMVLIFYFFRENKLALSISYIALSSIFVLQGLNFENLFLIN